MGPQRPPMQRTSCPAFSIVPKLNMRQQLFVEAYIATKGNGTESARRAGYKGSDSTLNVASQRLLRNEWVRAAIASRSEKAIAKVHKGVSPEEVIEELGGQLRGEKPARWATEDGKEYDPQRAAALLGKFLGLEKKDDAPTTSVVNLIAFFNQLTPDQVEQIRAAALKELPVVEAG